MPLLLFSLMKCVLLQIGPMFVHRIEVREKKKDERSQVFTYLKIKENKNLD